MDAARAQQILAEIKAKRFTKREFWNCKPGPNTIRILPSWTLDLSKDWFRKTAQHWKLGNGQDLWTTCLIEEGFERCPVCERIDALYRTDDSARFANEWLFPRSTIIRQDSIPHFYNK